MTEHGNRDRVFKFDLTILDISSLPNVLYRERVIIYAFKGKITGSARGWKC